MPNEQRSDEAARARTAFGDVLRRLRVEQGLTQEALAHQSDYHPVYVRSLELGRHSPSLVTILRLARVIGVDASELVRQVEQEITTGRGEGKT